MPTRGQQDRWREDRALIQRAADTVRMEARQAQGEALVGNAPIIPVERFAFVALLDELALVAGRGELASPVRRVTLELCRRIVDTDERITDGWPLFPWTCNGKTSPVLPCVGGTGLCRGPLTVIDDPARLSVDA